MDSSFHFNYEEDNLFHFAPSPPSSFPDIFNPDSFSPIQTEINNPPKYVLVPMPQPEEKKENVVKEKEDALTAEKTATKTSKNNTNSNSNNNEKKNGTKQRGPKKKSERNLGVSNGNDNKKEHTKFDEDNEMRKIKSYSSQFMIRYLNASLSPGHSKFLKINKWLNRDITIKINLELNQMKLKDVLTRYKILERYSKDKYDENYNAKLVEKILRDGTEKNAIDRLNQTYIEVLDIMRNEYLDEFKEFVLKKQIKSGENEETAKMHIEQVVDLLFRYENWFNTRIPRCIRKEKNCFN